MLDVGLVSVARNPSNSDHMGGVSENPPDLGPQITVVIIDDGRMGGCRHGIETIDEVPAIGGDGQIANGTPH